MLGAALRPACPLPRSGPRFAGLATLHPQICPHRHKHRGAAAIPGDPFYLSCKPSYKPPPPPGEAAQRTGPYDSCLVPPRGRGTRDIFRRSGLSEDTVCCGERARLHGGRLWRPQRPGIGHHVTHGCQGSRCGRPRPLRRPPSASLGTTRGTAPCTQWSRQACWGHQGGPEEQRSHMRVKQDARLGASALPGPGWALDRYRPIFRALFSLELELGNTEKSRDLQGALVRMAGVPRQTRHPALRAWPTTAPAEQEAAGRALRPSTGRLTARPYCSGRGSAPLPSSPTAAG